MELSDLTELVGECEKAIQWQRIKEQVVSIFGPTVKRVSIEVEGEYDDECGTNYRVSSVIASGDGPYYRLNPVMTPKLLEYYNEFYAPKTSVEDFLDSYPEDGWSEEGFRSEYEGTWDLTTPPQHPDLSRLVWLDHVEQGERHE